MNESIREGIMRLAAQVGANPVDIATVISYETGGTFDPNKAGPRTKWGQHRGLFQWGEPQARQYGVDWKNPSSQFDAAGKYLRDAGFKPGMGLMDLYSAVNAGKVGRNNASDTKAGGAPGTVADKVNNQMGPHYQNAVDMLKSFLQPGGYTANAYPPAPTPGAPGYTTNAFPPNGMGAPGAGGGVAPSQQPFSIKDYLLNKGQAGGTSRLGNAIGDIGSGGGGGAGGPQPPDGYQSSVAANQYQASQMPQQGQQFDPMAILKQLGLI